MTVRFSSLAAFKLEKLINELTAKWGAKIASNVINDIDNSIIQLKNFPLSCPVSEFDGLIRKCIVSKQTSMLYEVSDETIFILTIIDNRQDSEKIFKEIKKHFR